VVCRRNFLAVQIAPVICNPLSLTLDHSCTFYSIDCLHLSHILEHSLRSLALWIETVLLVWIEATKSSSRVSSQVSSNSTFYSMK